MNSPHPIFEKFQRYKGPVRQGSLLIDFLGTAARMAFLPTGLEPSPPHAESGYPEVSEDIFAWIDMLTAVLNAGRQFTMMELGAGYGLWSVRAAKAVEQSRGIPYRLIAAEAEPKHFEWLKLHFADNNLDPAQHRLVEAAVSGSAGTAQFYVSSPDAEASRPNDWWGQSLIQDYESIDQVTEHRHSGHAVVMLKTGWQSVEVQKVPLGSLLRDEELIDFIHMDIQREELPAIQSSIDELDRKVKYLHIGTHTAEIEAGLRELFQRYRWTSRADYPGNKTHQTPLGRITFQDGVQSWCNPKLGAV